MKGSTLAMLGLAVAAAVAAAAIAVYGSRQGTAAPYVMPVDPSVRTSSILRVGDSVNEDPASPGLPYRMVGSPDGLGAFDDGGNTLTVLMNHELEDDGGRGRAHGAAGAFVSKWTIEKETLQVLAGEDLIQQVALAPAGVHIAPAKGVALGRLCSGDLPGRGAFWADGVGYRGGLFLSGEEIRPEGRVFAHDLDGTSWELPHLGKLSWENAVANPGTGRATVVIGFDDSTPGEVYVYIGEKRRFGNPAERAGLVGGKLYGVRVPGITGETDATFPRPGSRFDLVDLGDASKRTGAGLQAQSTAAQVTKWQRPEDGSWDPRNLRDLYWVTTASIVGRSRLWRFRFDSLENPERGGVVDLMLDGTEGQKMLDNMTVDRFGRILLQEDPGDDPRLAKVWSYDIEADTMTELAQHDPERFAPPNSNEESSGIIPLDRILGKGWYLLSVQFHSQKRDTELVEGGALEALYYPTG